MDEIRNLHGSVILKTEEAETLKALPA
jgi:hypothetical protein